MLRACRPQSGRLALASSLGGALRRCSLPPRAASGHLAGAGSPDNGGRHSPPAAPRAAAWRGSAGAAGADEALLGSTAPCTLSRLPELAPQAVLGVVDALALAFLPSQQQRLRARVDADADATEAGEAAEEPGAPEDATAPPGAAPRAQPSTSAVGREAARSAAQALFAQAALLADAPAGALPAQGWVEALPVGRLWMVARACARGRHPSVRALSVNHGRRLMAAAERAVCAALRDARGGRAGDTGGGGGGGGGAQLMLLAYWSMRAGSAGALSQSSAPRLFGGLAQLAQLGGGLAAMRTADLCRLLHAYTSALPLLGGGPEPLSQLEVQTSDGAPWPGRAPTASRREQHAAAAKACGEQCRALLLGVHAELAGRIGGLTPAQLATVSWALAANGLPAQPLLRALGGALPAACGRMSAGELSNCLWALCCRGYLPREAVLALVGGLNAHAEAQGGGADGPACGGLLPAHRVQLHACDLALRLEGPWALRPTPALDRRLLGGDGARALGLSAGMAPGASSGLHMQVSALLSEMGTAHANEATVASLGCVVDILIAESAVVLEVLGVSHYAFGGIELTRSTALKLRLLRLQGWLVVELPYYEWNALGSSARARREYLANKIVGYAPCWIDL